MVRWCMIPLHFLRFWRGGICFPFTFQGFCMMGSVCPFCFSEVFDDRSLFCLQAFLCLFCNTYYVYRGRGAADAAFIVSYCSFWSIGVFRFWELFAAKRKQNETRRDSANLASTAERHKIAWPIVRVVKTIFLHGRQKWWDFCFVRALVCNFYSYFTIWAGFSPGPRCCANAK